MFNKEYAKKNEEKVFAEGVKMAAGRQSGRCILRFYTRGTDCGSGCAGSSKPIADGMEIYNIIEACGSIVCNLDKRVAELKEAVKKPKSGQIETTYSEGDIEQIRVRIEAFLELLQSKSV